MKRVFCFIFCTVLLLSLCSCQQSTAPLTWSEETQAKIKRDYAKFQNDNTPNGEDITADDVSINFYFGIYHGDAVALLISGMTAFPTVIVEEDIAGIHFSFGSTQPLYIYNEGTFTPLKEAYEKGIVSKEDVQEIHTRHERRSEYYVGQ